MKFGNPCTAMARYALGSSFHSSERTLPLVPMIGKYGLKLTSKPVAHIIMSTSYSCPVEVLIPFSVNDSISPSANVTFGSWKHCKNPSAGPSRRHPRGKSGTNLFTSTGSSFKAVFILFSIIFRSVRHCWCSTAEKHLLCDQVPGTYGP